jgi:hypothetical protein
MPKPSEVIVVVEDERHEMLVRRFLKNAGVEEHQLRVEKSPSGQGSAEQWVKTRFVKEVSAYRTRQARAATSLIIIIDADTHTVQHRLRQLAQVLVEQGAQPVNDREQIIRLIPKRNVETWILCLNEHRVEEITDYKTTRNDWNDLIPVAARTLFQWSRANAVVPDLCIGSLREGVRELNRLRF